MGSDGLAQGKVARRLLVVGHLPQRLARAASDQACPHLIGKLLHRWFSAAIGSARAARIAQGSEDLLQGGDPFCQAQNGRVRHVCWLLLCLLWLIEHEGLYWLLGISVRKKPL
jgi:hypothetical protein